MGALIKQLAKSSIKLSEKTLKVDPNSPISMDTTNFLLKASKHLVDFLF